MTDMNIAYKAMMFARGWLGVMGLDLRTPGAMQYHIDIKRHCEMMIFNQKCKLLILFVLITGSN